MDEQGAFAAHMSPHDTYYSTVGQIKSTRRGTARDPGDRPTSMGSVTLRAP